MQMSMRLGRYETLRAIASGGMGTVYLGRALGAGGFERLVALKVMHPHIATDPDFVAMFFDEARLAASIRHPNVVATIDVNHSAEGLFLVMEYVEGPSLHVILRALKPEQGILPLNITLRIFLDSLAGLHAAHELLSSDGQPLNLVHRDVSPQNILVGADGITRITDFGIARAESRLSTTRGGQLKGKIAYMAPEQVLSKPIDRRCDLYAAGVVFWEMLTGRRLFQADSDAAMFAKVLEGATISPRGINESIPEAIDEVCMGALRPNPAVRYPTAAAFAEALEAAALSANVAVATPRGVANYVKDLEPKITANAAPTIQPPPNPEFDGPTNVTRPNDASMQGSLRSGMGPPSQTPGAAISTPAALSAPKQRSRVPAIVGAIGAAAALGGAAVFFLTKPNSPVPVVAAVAERAAVTIAPSTAPVGVAPTSSAIVSPSAATAGSASAPTEPSAEPATPILDMDSPAQPSLRGAPRLVAPGAKVRPATLSPPRVPGPAFPARLPPRRLPGAGTSTVVGKDIGL